MGKAKERQVIFYPSDAVFQYISTLPAGKKSAVLNKAIEEHIHKLGKRRTTELEGWHSWLEYLSSDPESGLDDKLAAAIARLIHGYYQAMHDDYIAGWESQGKPVPIDHRPCKYCGDDV